MAKKKRATWWKMLYFQRATIESISNEDAGSGLKAAFRYFDGEEITPDDLCHFFSGSIRYLRFCESVLTDGV